MRFAPQRRALFQHLNFQKCSKNGVLCTLWLGNVLRAATACTFSSWQFLKSPQTEMFCRFWLRHVLRAASACTFSTSQVPKALRSWGVLRILTWKCASRDNGVQLFISHLPRWLRTRRPAALASLLIDPPEPQIIGKAQCSATFLPFRAHASSFFWLFLFSNLLSSFLLFFSSPTLPTFAF